MEKFLSKPNINLDDLRNWLESDDPQCASEIKSISDPQKRLIAIATRRQAIFLFLGATSPIELYVNPISGETVETVSMCVAARKLLEPRQLEDNRLPAGPGGSGRTFKRQLRKVTSFVQDFAGHKNRLLNSINDRLLHSINDLAASAKSAILTPSVAMSYLIVSALSPVSMDALILGAIQNLYSFGLSGAAATAAIAAVSVWKYGMDRRAIALQEIKDYTLARHNATIDGVWYTQNKNQLLQHLYALMELDIKIKKNKLSGFKLIDDALTERKKRPRIFRSKEDSLALAYNALRNAYLETENLEGTPDEQLEEFRRIILNDYFVKPMIRCFHLFDHTGNHRSFDNIMKAFAIQEKDEEKVIFSYATQNGAKELEKTAEEEKEINRKRPNSHEDPEEPNIKRKR
jgi:hypothetical protein